MGELNTLLIKVKNKDAVAFKELYQKTSPKLYALCLKLVNNDETSAESLLQESFMKIWRNTDSFNPDQCTPIVWMATVVRNQSFDRLLAANTGSHRLHKNLSQSVTANIANAKGIKYADHKSHLLNKNNYTEQMTAFKHALETLPDAQQLAVR